MEMNLKVIVYGEEIPAPVLVIKNTGNEVMITGSRDGSLIITQHDGGEELVVAHILPLDKIQTNIDNYNRP